MPYSYKKLLGKIVEVYGTQAKFAEALNLSERSVSLKLNGKVEWKQGEMIDISRLLHFPPSKIPEYFFTPEVQD